MHDPGVAAPATYPDHPELTRGGRSSGPRPAAHLFFGVLLPVLALALSEWCASAFFDPVPTPLHWVLVSLVPAFNLLVCLHDDAFIRRWSLDLLGAIGLGIAFIYVLVFLPLLPAALLAIPVLGLGLLPLAPLTSFVVAARALWRMHRSPAWTNPARSTVTRLAGGFLVGVGALLVPELPALVTEIGVEMAASSDQDRAVEGIQFLRRWGSERELGRLAASSGIVRGPRVGWLLGGPRTESAAARRAHYLVTGRIPDTSEKVGDRTFERQMASGEARVRGGSQIGLVVPTTLLQHSRLDGSIDAEAAVGYVEWDMVFGNRHPTNQAEARARLALPAGAVISRVTLWIDGEPREAAFGSTGQVRTAYQSVVRRRRDPLLVTSVGPDLVQVQCFPIPPDGGTMRIRLGITFPLQLDGEMEGWFALPRIEASNFAAAEAREVWFEADTAMRLSGRRSRPTPSGGHSLRFSEGYLGDASVPRAVFVVRNGTREAWTRIPDGLEDASGWVRQTLEGQDPGPPERLALVLDSSLGMDEAADALAAALDALPPDVQVRLALPTDRGFDWDDLDSEGLAARLREVRSGGGVDNAPALAAAGRWASEVSSGVVLWLHGPQPVPLTEDSAVTRIIERSTTRLIHAQVLGGEHHLVTQIGDIERFDALPRSGGLELDLRRLFEQWSGARPSYRWTRTRPTSPVTPSGKQTSEHLARLWAWDEVRALRSHSAADAAELAVTHRLVTPMTGAVVLETVAQYEQAGLNPDADTPLSAPAVPEPETWALLLVSLGLLLWQAKRAERPRVAA